MRPISFGQASARQTLQSGKSAQQLFSIQRSAAKKALASGSDWQLLAILNPTKWDAPLSNLNVDRINPMAYFASEQLECSMPTRNVVLNEHQENLVAGLVASGRYRNVSEAIRAGLRLLEREEAELTALSQRLAKGVKQAMDGELAEGTGSDAIRRAFAKARPA